MFNEKDIEGVQRNFFRALVNTYQFFTLYANIDGFTGAEEEVPVPQRCCVVHQGVDLLSLDLVQHRRHRLRVADVAAVGHRRAASRGHRALHVGGGLIAGEVEEVDPIPVAGQGLHDGSTDAPGAPAHHRGQHANLRFPGAPAGRRAPGAASSGTGRRPAGRATPTT